MEKIMLRVRRKAAHWLMLCLCLLHTPLFLMSSCSKDDDKEAPRLEVSPEELMLDSNGEGTLTITANTMWSVSTSAKWLTFSSMSGVGDGSVSVGVIGNSTSDRTAVVTVKGENISRQAVVTQKGTPSEPSTPSPETPSGPSTPSESSKQTFNVAGVSFSMVRVEGGTFWMGATAEQGDDTYSDEKPAHQVTLSTYYIGETEVTQELWKVVMGSNPSYFSGSKHPVEDVSWDNCQTFINKLNQLTGKNFRLPTEAEWEFAARGGNKSKGFKYAGSNSIGDVAWCGSNSGDKTHEVGTKQANELGIYDMSGNVWEWCQDWYVGYSSNVQTNPAGPSTGSYRVNRGGSWFLNAWYCRVSYRNYYTPTSTGGNLGLRLALQ